MRLVKEFIIKDILDYELNEEVNIIENLQAGNWFIVIDLIKLGNKCDDAEAESILDKAIETMTMEEVLQEIAFELVGRETSDKENNVDKKQYTSFSEILEDFYNQIQTVDENLGLNEFWGLSTRYLYRYADGLQKRYVYNTNKELQSQYHNVAMFMQALGGKLKECPRLNEDGTLHKQSLEDKLKMLSMGGV